MKMVRKIKNTQINFTPFLSGTPKQAKILDYQGMTLGHPSIDIWTLVYSATDAEYRATSLDEDLRAYFDVLSTYMDTPADYAEFKQEVEEGRIYGLVMFSEFQPKNPSPLT